MYRSTQVLGRTRIPSSMDGVKVETDQIRMETDADIISFQFSSHKMETDRIRMKSDADILDIYFLVFLPFPSLGR